MRLSKPIYEKLPLIYFGASVALFFRFDDIIAHISALLLYVASAMVSVMRSDYRRQTRISKTVPGLRLPQFVYEYYPWAFIAVSIVLVKYKADAIGIGIALPLALFALKIMYVRRQSRRINLMRYGAKSS
ncbi:hypothetical protein E2K93_14790 [Thalassotalea sp. HSM 43]|uniref:hypothetical protein n=1 Tax=Thalassotalea sp. HSM 43 TaxID=2552945 RepID=UPI001082303C|nr:hypothetical protein [Thalassotalea sp. HSM 43]QBY05561.1 hypothetical protein E2K93_14790 [Thalassotalea sp. HSM 43]